MGLAEVQFLRPVVDSIHYSLLMQQRLHHQVNSFVAS